MFAKILFCLFTLIVFVIASISASGHAQQFKSDVVWTHILEEISLVKAWLIVCAVTLFAILSKVWSIQETIEESTRKLLNAEVKKLELQAKLEKIKEEKDAVPPPPAPVNDPSEKPKFFS